MTAASNSDARKRLEESRPAAGAGLSAVVDAILAELPMSDDGAGHVADCGYTHDDPTCACYTLRSRIAGHVAARVAAAEQDGLGSVERGLFGTWRAYAEHLEMLGHPETIKAAAEQARAEVEAKVRALEGQLSRALYLIDKRLFDNIDRDAPNGCWEWSGGLNKAGYGRIAIGGRSGGMVYVHRYVWELLIGDIPDAMTLDHLCLNKICCNPGHLEICTKVENARRFTDGLQACRRAGHAYTAENTRFDKEGKRHCRACEKARWHERKAAAQQATNPADPAAPEAEVGP